LAGLIVLKYFPEAGGVNFPLMNSPYRSFNRMWSVLSGAGA